MAKLRFRRFSEDFWPLFRSFLGGNINIRILPPEKERKIGSKSPGNRRNLSFATISFFFFSFCLAASEIFVDLRNPIYENGVLRTSEGGVLQGPHLRIQARRIEYTRSGKIHRIQASGDLMILRKGKIFIGEELDYDIEENRGFVSGGRTALGRWYASAQKIELHPDGSCEAENAAITTSENKNSSWDLFAGRLIMPQYDCFIGKNISVRLFQIPTLWIPSLKLDLKKGGGDSLARWSCNWDAGQGPRAAMRYQLYSWHDFDLFGRIEYRWGTGWGGAIETEYFPPGGRGSLITRSYAGTDRLETAMNKQFRFRVEGAGRWMDESGKTRAALLWDKYSDVRMPSDFRNEDFEVGTAQQTLFWLHHKERFAIASIKARVRLNAFESVKQDLPTFYTHILPQALGSSGILSFFHLKASYLDFAYSNQLASTARLHPPADFRSGRLEARQRLHRPIRIGPLTFTPHLGALGIFYTNNPSHCAAPLGCIFYGADLTARAQKTHGQLRHIFEPYANFEALSTPSSQPNDHYIFSIQDGYHQIHQIRAGLRNLLFSTERTGREPLFEADLYANGFFSHPAVSPCIPRLYLKLGWHFPSLDAFFHHAWNFHGQALDFANARIRWTIHENCALSVEGRYRSEYDWRKADHENFILDVSRSESELLASPLSDRRISLLADLFVRFSPFWECRVQTHHGFYRKNETPYNEFKVDLFTWIASSLKLRISFSHTDTDPIRIGCGIDLVKK